MKKRSPRVLTSPTLCIFLLHIHKWELQVGSSSVQRSGKQIKRWRDKDNREVEVAAVDGCSSPGVSTPGTHTISNTDECKHQVHSWLRQSDGRATENTHTHTHTHTHKRQCITSGQTELSYLSFIALVFFPRLLFRLPLRRKANAASARWVSSSRASSFHGPGKKRGQKGETHH